MEIGRYIFREVTSAVEGGAYTPLIVEVSDKTEWDVWGAVWSNVWVETFNETYSEICDEVMDEVRLDISNPPAGNKEQWK